MTLDPDLVFRKIVLIGPDLEQMKRLSELSEAEFLADPLHELVAERLLERVIGRMIDINYHLLTSMGRAPPKDYRASFIELGAAGLIRPEFAAEIATCAGLRNRIAHMYDEIDPAVVHAALADAVVQIPAYADAVRVFVEASAGA